MASNDEFRILIDELELYGYNRKRLAERINYSQDAIRKALRNGPSEKMYNQVKALHESEREKAVNPINDLYERVQRIERMQDILLTALCDVLAKMTQRSSAIIKSEYEKLIDQPTNK